MLLRRARTPFAAPFTAAPALPLTAPTAHAAANPGPGFPAQFTAPYVEAWNSPGAIASAQAATGAKHHTLAFVINGNGSCNATFNGSTSINDAGSSTTPGTQAQIWSCSQNANQQWTMP